MANHQSAIKRHKQSEKRNARNTATRTALKTAIKKHKEALTAGKPEEITSTLGTATKLLDKAVTKGVLHRNNASRKISRLTVHATKAK
ncbi:MAG: 30S ribosomal protein S20 [Deltaproteobacteria bacterium]